MAKPLDFSDILNATSTSDFNASFDMSPGTLSRKRKHDPDKNPIEAISDEYQKTRRVNPQRLAARLGAEIVAEMEALIYPGAKMPPFEVRRVIQERYAVDRRHIYDYFHSRGLRVAKEDKHMNLMRGRLSKSISRQSLEKPVDSMEEQPCKDDPPIKLTMERTKPYMRIAPPEDKLTDKSTHISLTKRPRLKQKQSFDAQEEPLHRKWRLATENTSGITLERAVKASASLGFLSVCYNTSSSLGPELVKDEASEPYNDVPDTESIFLPVNILNDEYGPLAEHGTVFPFEAHGSNDSEFLDYHQSLDETQRMELYDFINKHIEVSCGSMECVGTYFAYMKQHSQYYYDPLTRMPSRETQQVESSSDESGNESVDFEGWLFDLGEHLGENGLQVPGARNLQDSVTNQPLVSQQSLVSMNNVSQDQSGDSVIIRDLYNVSTKNNVPCIIELCPQEVGNFLSTNSLGLLNGPFGRENLVTRFLESESIQRKQLCNRLRSATQLQASGKETDADSSTLSPLGAACIPPPICQDFNRSGICITRPTRMRTMSAGGGI